MLEVAVMGLHVAQMSSQAQMQACFDAVTVNAARVMGLDGYGLAVGKQADLVLQQARSPLEALRLRATRLRVLRRGCVLARTAHPPHPPRPRCNGPAGRPAQVDWTLQR